MLQKTLDSLNQTNSHLNLRNDVLALKNCPLPENKGVIAQVDLEVDKITVYTGVYVTDSAFGFVTSIKSSYDKFTMAAKVKLVYKVGRKDMDSYSYYSLGGVDTSQTGLELSANDFDALKELGCEVSGFVTIDQLYQKCASEKAKKKIEEIKDAISGRFNIGIVAYVKCAKTERMLQSEGEAYFGKTALPLPSDMSVSVGNNNDILSKMKKDDGVGMYLPSIAIIMIIGLLML